MFNWLAKLFGIGEQKRIAGYQEKQRNNTFTGKCKCDTTQKGIAFFIRLKRRRAKNIMGMNTRRQLRGLPAY